MTDQGIGSVMASIVCVRAMSSHAEHDHGAQEQERERLAPEGDRPPEPTGQALQRRA